MEKHWKSYNRAKTKSCLSKMHSFHLLYYLVGFPDGFEGRCFAKSKTVNISLVLNAVFAQPRSPRAPRHSPHCVARDTMIGTETRRNINLDISLETCGSGDHATLQQWKT